MALPTRASTSPAIVLLTALGALLIAGAGWGQEQAPSPTQTAILDTQSYWRCHLTFRPPVSFGPPGRRSDRVALTAAVSPAPPEGWMQPGFDDGGWWRSPGPFYGGYGFAQPTSLALVCLRGEFRVVAPGRVRDLTLSAAFRGGAAVYLNGQEVARRFLPRGEIGPETPAEEYPWQVYVTPEGKGIRWGWGDPQKYKDRCEGRIRRLNGLSLPVSLLKEGINVLGIEIHRAPHHPDARTLKADVAGWGHCGLLEVRLRTSSADAVAANTARPPGVQIWNANPLVEVYQSDYGEPGGRIRPIRLVGTRNGACSGQVIVGSSGPITGLRAAMSDLLRGGGGRIPAGAVAVRYARPGVGVRGLDGRYGDARDLERFDILAERPPAEVAVWRPRATNPEAARFAGAVQPVWITVNIPANALAGDYEGALTVSADGLPPVAVPVHLTVCAWRLPRPREFLGHVGLIQSPDSVALQYDVRLWSDRHFELIARSLEQLGKVGNKTVYIPLMCKTNFGNEQSMVRWIRRQGSGIRGQGSGIRRQGPGVRDRGSGIGGQGARVGPVSLAPDARGLTPEVGHLTPDIRNLEPATYTRDYTIMDRYLDLYEKHVGRPGVVCLYVWDPFTGGHPRWSKKRIEPSGAPVTVVDPATGAVSEMAAPIYGTPESRAFWKPVLDEVRDRLHRRGLSDDSIMVGIAGDQLPTKEVVDFFSDIAPYAKWVWHTHSNPRRLYDAPVGYLCHIWNTGFAPDPSERRFYGWRNPRLEGAFPRHGVGLIHPPLYPHSPLGVHRWIVEGAFLANQRGFGRIGADFWPVIKDPRGRMKTISARYPISDLGHINLTLATTGLLAPGPEGAISTIRLEMLREGLQQAEARAFIERALTDEDLRARLGRDVADRCQEILDQRTCSFRAACRTSWNWYAASGWEERTAALFSAAAAVAAGEQRDTIRPRRSRS